MYIDVIGFEKKNFIDVISKKPCFNSIQFLKIDTASFTKKYIVSQPLHKSNIF